MVSSIPAARNRLITKFCIANSNFIIFSKYFEAFLECFCLDATKLLLREPE